MNMPPIGIHQPVHDVMYASQPDIQIRCDESWTQPAWKTFPKGGPYETTDGRLYTFTDEHVTCKKCLECMEQNRAKQNQ